MVGRTVKVLFEKKGRESGQMIEITCTPFLVIRQMWQSVRCATQRSLSPKVHLVARSADPISGELCL
jgi:hypothetical protein